MNSFEQKVKNALYPFPLDKCFEKQNRTGGGRRGRGYLQNGLQNQVKARLLLVYFSLVVYWNIGNPTLVDFGTGTEYHRYVL